MGARAHLMPFIDFQGDKDTTVPPVNADQRVQQWLLTNDLADDGTANRSVATTAASTASGGSGSRTYTISTYRDKAKNELGTRWVVHGMTHAWSGGNASLPYSDAAGPGRDRRDVRVLHAPPRPVTDASGTPRREPADAAVGTIIAGPGGDTVHVVDERTRPSAHRVKLKLLHGRITFTLSGPGSATLRLRQRVTGHCPTGSPRLAAALATRPRQRSRGP